MSIQSRRGNYGDFDKSKMLAGEFAVVLQDDPNTSDGKAVYMAFSPGSAKRLATYEDMVSDLEAATAEATAQAEAAAESIEQSAEQITTNTEDIADLKDDLSDVQELTIEDVYNVISFELIKKKYIAGNTGAVDSINDSRYKVSDYIPVLVGHTYLITASANYSNALVAFYDANYNVVSGSIYTGGSSGSTVKIIEEKEFVAPENAVYLAIASFSANIPAVKEYKGKVNILEERVELLESVTPDTTPTVRLAKTGNNLIITDILSQMYLTCSLNGSFNGAFNIGSYYKADGTTYKTAGDDICPIYYDSSYRCANHGNNVARKVISPSHGLTSADIGKVFTSENSINYVLVNIIDADSFNIIQDADTHSFYTGAPTSPLTGNGMTIAFTSSTLDQLLPSINNVVQSVTVDGEPVIADGNYVGRTIEITESYVSIDTLAMLAELKSNVGNNSNTSYYAEDLSGDLRYTTSYTIKSGLQMIVSSKIITLRDDVNITRWGCSQSQQIMDGRRIFVPDSDDADIYTLSGSKTYAPETWANSNFPPYKVYQFDVTENSGFAMAYILDYANGIPNTRKSLCDTSAVNIADSKKVYPFVIMTDSNHVPKYTEYSAITIRQPIELDNTLKIISEINGGLYVNIDKRTDGTEIVTIPKGYNGKIIDILHSGGYISVGNVSISNNEIVVIGKGSLTAKLT